MSKDGAGYNPWELRIIATNDTVDGCEILHHLIGGLSVDPIIYRVSTIQGDAGFLPSTVWI